jgi:arylsulfate sulfotransferase
LTSPLTHDFSKAAVFHLHRLLTLLFGVNAKLASRVVPAVAEELFPFEPSVRVRKKEKLDLGRTEMFVPVSSPFRFETKLTGIAHRKFRIALSVPIVCACALLAACGTSGSSNTGSFHGTISSSANPMVAQYTVGSGCTGQVTVEFGPDTNYGRSTAAYPINAFQPLTILVAGMRASTAYHMRAQRVCGGDTATTEDQTFTTGAPPSLPFPATPVTRAPGSTSAAESPGIELVDTIGPAAHQIQAFFTDRDGNPIWYYNVDPDFYPFTFKLLSNGHILFILASNAGDTRLREVDLAGNTIRDLDITVLQGRAQAAGLNFVPQGFHHDFLALENGHLIILVTQTKDFADLPGYPGTTTVIGDGLIDLDENWNPVWAWNGFDYLDVNRHLFGLPDWTHANAVVYSPTDGNLIMSMRHQSWVLKINYANGSGTGNVLWRLGYQGDFALTNNGVPTDDPSEWFSFQHYPSIVDQNGSQTTLAIWDNGDFRALDTSGATCLIPGPPACYSRATVFQVDDSAMVANLAWTDLPGNFSLWGGSINQLSNGNIEFDMNAPANAPDAASASVVQEVTQTATPTVIWKMNVALPMNAYRAYRVPSLYPGVTWQF